VTLPVVSMAESSVVDKPGTAEVSGNDANLKNGR
jgi:hypothetical protein